MDLPDHFRSSDVKCCAACDFGTLRVQHTHLGDGVIVLCEKYGIVLPMTICDDFVVER